jgi:hypothetical protein
MAVIEMEELKWHLLVKEFDFTAIGCKEVVIGVHFLHCSQGQWGEGGFQQ